VLYSHSNILMCGAEERDNIPSCFLALVTVDLKPKTGLYIYTFNQQHLTVISS